MNVKKTLLDTLHKHTKDELSKTGIYTITSKTTKKIYVGSAIATKAVSDKAIGFRVRWIAHYNKLINNLHPNKHLQRHVNKYGINDLEFEILDTCDPKYAIDLERYWIHMTNSVNTGFNNSYPGTKLLKNNNVGYKKVDEDKIIRLYKNTDLSSKKIAKQLMLSEYKVVTVLREHGIKLDKFITSDTTIMEIYSKYKNGESIEKKLSLEYELSPCTILNMFHRNNLPVINKNFKKKQHAV